MEYTIKKVGSEDIPVLAVLASEIWNQHFVPIIGQGQVDYMLERFQSVGAIEKQLSEGMTYLMVSNGSENVAYCGFKKDADRVFLSKLYVKKEYRGRHISTKMLGEIKDYAVGNGLKAVYLTVNKHNDDTVAIYKHIGFKVIDSVVTDIGGGYVMDDYIMQLDY